MLLDWLDGGNRENAARKYEKIRRSLIRIFRGRGCDEAERLADETFDRVIGKLPEIADGYAGEPELYFYGVADKIHHEWLRKQRKTYKMSLPETEDDGDDTARIEIEYDCLESCLEKLPVDEHRLITAYHTKEKSAKIENRQRLAESFGLNAAAMHVKTSRIRARLRECMRACLAAKILA